MFDLWSKNLFYRIPRMGLSAHKEGPRDISAATAVFEFIPKKLDFQKFPPPHHFHRPMLFLDLRISLLFPGHRPGGSDFSMGGVDWGEWGGWADWSDDGSDYSARAPPPSAC